MTSVSGLLTKPGLGVWSNEPDGRPPLVADLDPEAAAVTTTVPVERGHDGTASVAACTVTFEGQEPGELVTLLDTPAGARVIGRSADRVLVERAMTEGLVGRTVHVAGTTVTSDGR